MRKKFIMAAGLILILGVTAMLGKHFVSAFNNRIHFSRVPTYERNKMEGVSIKKHVGSAVIVIDAAILKPRVFMPVSFFAMVLNEDSEYTLRLRDVRFHLTDSGKDLLIEGSEALSNSRFTALIMRKQSILSNNGYTIDPNAQYINIKISGNKVEVLS